MFVQIKSVLILTRTQYCSICLDKMQIVKNITLAKGARVARIFSQNWCYLSVKRCSTKKTPAASPINISLGSKCFLFKNANGEKKFYSIGPCLTGTSMVSAVVFNSGSAVFLSSSWIEFALKSFVSARPFLSSWTQCYKIIYGRVLRILVVS